MAAAHGQDLRGKSVTLKCQPRPPLECAERCSTFPVDRHGWEGFMAARAVTRADLSEAVYQEVGLSRKESAQLVESVLHEISDALARGETVKLSSFGTFMIHQRGERVGRNPKTGDKVPILPRRVLVFRASHVLKSRINESLSRSSIPAPTCYA